MQRRRRDKGQGGGDNVIKNLTELREGAPVVHIDHGVGRYLGLVTLEVDGQAAEFLCSLYAEEAKLYVPVASLHLIARYTGSDDALAPLHRLGSEQLAEGQAQGRRAGARCRRRTARHLRAPGRPSRASPSATRPSTTRPSAPASPSRRPPTSRPPSTRCVADMLGRPADGSPGVRRRRLRQDRGGHARRLHRRAQRQAGGGAGAHHPARPAALQQLPRPLRRLAGDGRGDEPLQVGQGSRRSGRRKLAEGKIDIVIGTHKLLQDDVQLQGPGPGASSTRSTASACARRSSSRPCAAKWTSSP